MESEIWTSMDDALVCSEPIIAVDNDGNYRYYESMDAEDIAELKYDGYTKWCYLADLVQAAYNL